MDQWNLTCGSEGWYSVFAYRHCVGTVLAEGLASFSGCLSGNAMKVCDACC